MIDPAFLSFSDALAALIDFGAGYRSEEEGVDTYIYECTIEMPIELDVARGDDGTLALGTVPPLYYVDTSFRPAYHRVRITAVQDGADDGG